MGFGKLSLGVGLMDFVASPLNGGGGGGTTEVGFSIGFDSACVGEGGPEVGGGARVSQTRRA